MSKNNPATTGAAIPFLANEEESRGSLRLIFDLAVNALCDRIKNYQNALVRQKAGFQDPPFPWQQYAEPDPFDHEGWLRKDEAALRVALWLRDRVRTLGAEAFAREVREYLMERGAGEEDETNRNDPATTGAAIPFLAGEEESRDSLRLIFDQAVNALCDRIQNHQNALVRQKAGFQEPPFLWRQYAEPDPPPYESWLREDEAALRVALWLRDRVRTLGAEAFAREVREYLCEGRAEESSDNILSVPYHLDPGAIDISDALKKPPR
jgi:hypothetical protein